MDKQTHKYYEFRAVFDYFVITFNPILAASEDEAISIALTSLPENDDLYDAIVSRIESITPEIEDDFHIPEEN